MNDGIAFFKNGVYNTPLGLTAETNVMIKDQWPLWNKIKPSEEH